MFIKPQEVLLASPFWETEETSIYFLLQHRKGHGNSKGLSSLLVGTIDSIFDTKPAPYRILHQTPSSEVYYLIACSMTRQEILKDWDWLFNNVSATLHCFDTEDEITDFVTCKIESVIATRQEVDVEDEDSKSFKVTSDKFIRLFGLSKDEKLVNYYSCCYWKGKLPRQGWMYLSVHYCCFYAFILGLDTKVCIRWSDVIELSKKNSIVFPDSIKIVTREKEYHFSMFLTKNETFKLMEQLVDLAMKRLIDDKRSFSEDKELLHKLSARVSGDSTRKRSLHKDSFLTVQQQCPARSEISPCSCTLKKNGLDILCEFTDQQHITSAMDKLKGREFVIFYLKLRHNNLRKLTGYIFLGLDIHHLTIHNSSLSTMEEMSLSSIGKMLTQLDVSQNSLTAVPSSAFASLHQLLILNMNHNKISVVHSKAFQGLDTLEILTLYENKITTIEDGAFVGLEKKLKRLNLGGNSLTEVPQKALSILDTLKKLEMQENRLTEIKEGDFEGLKNLDSLGLAHNKLRQVPSRVFSHLTVLNSLELDGNNIDTIDPEAFAGLEENLQYLRLGDNNIHTIPTEALKRLHRLRHLDLRSNNISYIAEDAFIGFGDSITFLNLQKNFIRTLTGLTFENLNSLETLNLQNNKLMHIGEDVMEPILDTLRVVDIMDNPLLCNCELQWYKNWLRSLKDKDDEMMQKKRTVCMMQQEHREYNLQNLPLGKMNCVIKSYDNSPSGSNRIGYGVASMVMSLWACLVRFV
ncbi:hypothetical protein TcasGA2_TC032528 [Tribolium castaneum]|uniref:GRAM domain-containing protein n=1 Tax=Tribolium castaneum TaxID=7070 RepID=A0A139WCJ5_TRICA|nr:hypothetical protein TcasGA2_TC032528 [Tribolium castaneum]